jgi:hypothetical protein
MLGGREKKKAYSPGKTRSDSASDLARNRNGGIRNRKSSNATVGLINYCLAMVSMTIAAVGFSDDSKRPRVKGTINRTAVQYLCRLGGINLSGVREDVRRDMGSGRAEKATTAKTSAGSRSHRSRHTFR